MVERIYQTVQALMNKDSLGYFKPMDYNLYASTAQYDIYNSLFYDHKTEVRRSNWMLDGKGLANLSEFKAQLLEHFSIEKTINKIPNADPNIPVFESQYKLPDNLEYIMDIFVFETGKRADKVSLSDLRDLARNIYAKPTDCSPLFSKSGNVIKLMPPSVDRINLAYLRKPKTPKYTFQEHNGVHYFDDTQQDFQDFDLPSSLQDTLVTEISRMAGINLRDVIPIQSSQQEQANDAQEKTTQ